MKRSYISIAAIFFVFVAKFACAEDGYDLWMRYLKISNQDRLTEYRNRIKSWHIGFSSPTADVIRYELQRALPPLLDLSVAESAAVDDGSVLLITAHSPLAKDFGLLSHIQPLSNEGYVIITKSRNGKRVTVVISKTEIGVLYGMFNLLRVMQTEQSLADLNIVESPKTTLRILNHWDNLDRTVERGYAGASIWDWHKLPDYIDPRYIDYARANASVGINGTVLTNVNAKAIVLTRSYLLKVKALADVLRPYGIKVYLTARFNAPIELKELPTADAADPRVQLWWKKKAEEIYALIPDFGGFLVKANSEGQPGPQAYNRTHADGANLLASALQPHGGIVMWRAFVYEDTDRIDRAKQAYNEFKPLDGKFARNVTLQVKNGPVDFQPREPFHPLFGAMPKTPLMIEFQITQEYLGFATHLVYLAPLFKECLTADTFVEGKGSFVAKIVDGSLHNYIVTGMAGVANIGNDRNWCGHPFGQANWFAFGRLAWNHELTSGQIAEEWIKMTFNNSPDVISTCKQIMMESREAAVNYMTPLGLHHMMGWHHHYGPGPWISNKPRADWTSVYYHQADSSGIGFNRTPSGSNAVEQYAPEIQKLFSDPATCPRTLLLWFHHLPWDYEVRPMQTLWEALCQKYDEGVKTVSIFQQRWQSMEGKIDKERHAHVSALLSIQHKEAKWWRDACLLYFQQFSKRDFPEDFTPPEHELEYYQQLEFPYAPGISPRW